MSTITHPGPDFPARPSVSLEAPDGWGPFPLAEALVAVAAPERPGSYRANVCVTVERVPGVRSLDEASRALAATYAAVADFEQLGAETTTTLGLEAFRIEGGFSTDYAGTLFQAAHVVVLPQGPYTDVVTVVGTCHGSEALDVVPVLREVIAGAELQHAFS